MAVMLITHGSYEIDDDPRRLDVAAIHAFLSRDAYWSPGIPRDVLSRAIAGSLNFGLYRDGSQVGFARVVSDLATFAWLADVYVLPEHRGHGLGHRLVRAALDHPGFTGRPSRAGCRGQARVCYECGRSRNTISRCPQRRCSWCTGSRCSRRASHEGLCLPVARMTPS
jgi:GNAT superfamily N-acetyltransferase